jgi:hypothetical protein
MVKFSIKANGVDKLLFRIKEVNNRVNKEYKDLNITFPSSKRIYFPPRSGDMKELIDNLSNYKYYIEYVESHISVHCNPGKETITIKRSIKLNDNESVSSCQVNPGVKRDNLFVPIIFRIVGDIDDPIFDLSNSSNDRIVYLPTEYNPKKDQLRFMLVASSSEKHFTPHIEHPSNTLFYQFKNFTITIIYSFFNHPSHKPSINIVPVTFPETYNHVRGKDWWEIYNLYTDINTIYIKEYYRKYCCI